MTRPHPRNSGLIGLESGLDIRIFGSPQVTQRRAKVKSHCGGGQLLFLQASTAICNPLPFPFHHPPAKSRFCMGGQTSLITRCAGPSTMTCSWPSSAAAALRPSSTFSPPAQVGLLRKSSRSQLPPSPPLMLLFQQSLPSPECQKSSQICHVRAGGAGCAEITFQP